jgi:hypothetical protein
VLPASRRPIVVWSTAVVFAVITRTVALGRWPGLNGDEAQYGVNVQELLAGGTPFLTTGIGNPLSPLHSGLLLALSSVFEPSVALLRMPEVILGLAAVLLAYPLLRKPLGERPALLATVLLAVSPTAIAYSRLGWDPSGAPLLTLLAIGAALHNRAALALVAMAVAYLAHPTNVFALPFVFAAWVPHALARYRKAPASGQRRFLQAAIAAAVLAVPVGAWALIRIANNPATPLPSISMAIERMISPALWIDRAWGAFNLLSGVTSVDYVAGPLSPSAAAAATGIVGLIVAGALVYAVMSGRTHRHTVWLAAGLAASFAGFHIVAVPAAFQPGFERYALFLLTPMLIVAAVAIDAAIERGPLAGMTSAVVVAMTMVILVMGGYFYSFATRGGASAATYRTGAVEPKRAAFAFIEEDSRDVEAVTIVADDWWLYWSLRYFAGANTRFHVEPGPSASIPGGTHPPSAARRPVPAPERTYRVLFAEGGVTQARFTAVDPAGQPIVEVRLLSDQDRP